MFQPTLDVTEAEFDRVFSINVKSIFFSVQAAVPTFRKNGGGSIISISSIGSERPRPGLVWCKYETCEETLLVCKALLTPIPHRQQQ